MEQEQFKKEVLSIREDLLFYAQRLLEDRADAEDIVQEVFLKLWYMRTQLDRYNNVQALSVTITKHLCLNRLKVLGRKLEDMQDGEVVPDTDSPYQELERKDTLAHVMRIIDRLPDLQQTILRMKHVDGYEVQEIAELTGSSPDAIRMNLSRARRRVKELFFKMQEE
ncbi:sigma-70 family RNA polymerase sigma factor [Parabacteroides sp. 52]|uniref:RNA polymerase sigma factor n=1 Tax=unclassified Parabacteroides TaxID=2649774 RepID=UPI0013D87BAC|nr:MULTISPECIES: sigma-70 family RNA polymerase sigma factor [unclassified Parabacteroides]MDH6534431.1 RNA polymerase sigma factor (sigma-70 family) [Parabacteroides sp. PM5-20]NDV55120.1 sigma-70 family RNA polymerase sigma factor [Parabacteroides sp. 52]